MRVHTRVLTAIMAIAFALAALPAWAQQDKAPLTRRSDAQKQEDSDIDKAYQAAKKGDVIPAVKNDPWHIVRPADEDKKAKH
jgi:hypothetical protein